MSSDQEFQIIRFGQLQQEVLAQANQETVSNIQINIPPQQCVDLERSQMTVLIRANAGAANRMVLSRCDCICDIVRNCQILLSGIQSTYVHLGLAQYQYYYHDMQQKSFLQTGLNDDLLHNMQRKDCKVIGSQTANAQEVYSLTFSLKHFYPHLFSNSERYVRIDQQMNITQQVVLKRSDLDGNNNQLLTYQDGVNQYGAQNRLAILGISFRLDLCIPQQIIAPPRQIMNQITQFIQSGSSSQVFQSAGNYISKICFALFSRDNNAQQFPSIHAAADIAYTTAFQLQLQGQYIINVPANIHGELQNQIQCLKAHSSQNSFTSEFVLETEFENRIVQLNASSSYDQAANVQICVLFVDTVQMMQQQK